MEFGQKKFASGVVCLFSNKEHSAELEALLYNENNQDDGDSPYSFALVYFSKDLWQAKDINQLMATCASGLNYAACSTAGEITPQGLTNDQILIILFSKSYFEIEAFQVADRNNSNMEDVVSTVSHRKNSFFEPNSPSHPFVICIMDGMSHMEEMVTAALHWGLNDIPLLGGSAGDNLNFNETCLILNGVVVDTCAIILMVKSKLPIQLFKTDNFIPTKEKLIVTQSKPDQRTVYEFNGLPAAEIYAQTIGMRAKELTPQSFASHPLVVRVGGQYYCRSIQKVNEDGSMTFFCAIDDGVVLTVAEPTGMARSTQTTIEEIKTSLGAIDFILGFDCVLRQIDARNRQITQKISNIYQDNNIIGFNTYGEQYHSMHLNQTFTGIAFGMPKG